jgi:hypothetical protein
MTKKVSKLKLKHNLKWTEKNSILRNKKCSMLGKVSGSLYGRENGIKACAQSITIYRDNKFVGEYFSISEAARQLNLHKGKLSNVVRGLNKQHKGYTVQYA